MSEASEAILSKVRKLLAKAENEACTPEEAAAFSAKAQQLMSQHAISQAMIADASAPDQIVHKTWAVPSPHAVHKVTLINAICRSNDCQAIYSGTGNNVTITVTGFAPDVAWVETLYLSLVIQMASALAHSTRYERPANVHGRTYAVSFNMGFINRVSERLRQIRREAITAEQAHQDAAAGPKQSSSVALVLVAKAQRVEEEYRRAHPNRRTTAGPRARSWGGYGHGQSAGSKASIGRPVSGSRRRLSA